MKPIRLVFMPLHIATQLFPRVQGLKLATSDSLSVLFIVSVTELYYGWSTFFDMVREERKRKDSKEADFGPGYEVVYR